MFSNGDTRRLQRVVDVSRIGTRQFLVRRGKITKITTIRFTRRMPSVLPNYMGIFEAGWLRRLSH